MSERSDIELIRDILEAIRRISSYTTNLTYDDFLVDLKTQDAVTRDSTPQIPWRNMAALRDRLIHDYFGITFDIVWEIVSNELPPVGDSLEQIVGDKA